MDLNAYYITATGGETSVPITISAPGILIATFFERNDLGAVGASVNTFSSVSTGDFQLSPLTATADSCMFAIIALSNLDVTFGTSWQAPLAIAAAPSTTNLSDTMTQTAASGLVSNGSTVIPLTSPGNGGGGTTRQCLAFFMATIAGPLAISAGPNQSINTSQTVSLVGVPSGGVGTKTYAWSEVAGPTGSFSTANSATTTFTPTGGAGTYVLRITVTDASGTSSSDVTITVSYAIFIQVKSGGTWVTPTIPLKRKSGGVWIDI